MTIKDNSTRNKPGEAKIEKAEEKIQEGPKTENETEGAVGESQPSSPETDSSVTNHENQAIPPDSAYQPEDLREETLAELEAKEDAKIDLAAAKVEESFNPITTTEVRQAKLQAELERQKSEGPSALRPVDMSDVSAVHQNVINAKTTEAIASTPPASVDDLTNRPVAIDNADSAATGQGTTESYTTGQYNGEVEGNAQTIDPMTGQAMRLSEYQKLEAERNS